MSLSDTEFAAIMSGSKRIDGDIRWREDEDHSPARYFRAEVQTDFGWSLFVQGRYNRAANKLTYALILRTDGRVYGLDMGRDHRGVGEIHKHWWSEPNQDKNVYAPIDITASVHDPVRVWDQFCQEAEIEHDGRMDAPPSYTERFI